ncbi:LysR substrate-binding domain-containing protein [Shimia sp.]|uniref:LysR substrate-binding domain-containing protein n=1 Tax=Shimia sp. TaxID=1954381 RepID=UPI0032978444
MTRLPPLNALRAFEAAARHNGFIDAASELHVTRGAISRHVAILEEHLGVQLFRRNHRGVELTRAGQSLLPVLSDAFARISTETDRLSAGATDLRIICPPGLSIRWLFPRLDQFRALHPGIRVRLTTEFYGYSGFDSSEYDLGVSLQHWPGRADNIVAQPLFPMRLAPACAPGLANAQLPLRDPADLQNFTLLHENASKGDWAAWAQAFNLPELHTNHSEVFPNLDMATRAAVMGGGIVMADLYLCREELDRGELTLPFPDMAFETKNGQYALIGPHDRWDDPKIKAFREWATTATPNAPACLVNMPL